MKLNQTFFYGTYSSLRPYLFCQKILKYFNHFKNRKFHSFMTKMISNNENETKIDFFPRDILTLFTIVRKILTYLNDFSIKVK